MALVRDSFTQGMSEAEKKEYTEKVNSWNQFQTDTQPFLKTLEDIKAKKAEQAGNA